MDELAEKASVTSLLRACKRVEPLWDAASLTVFACPVLFLASCFALVGNQGAYTFWSETRTRV